MWYYYGVYTSYWMYKYCIVYCVLLGLYVFYRFLFLQYPFKNVKGGVLMETIKQFGMLYTIINTFTVWCVLSSHLYTLLRPSILSDNNPSKNVWGA